MTADRSVLVTGAAGFFGSAIVRALTRDGCRVIAVDRVAANGFVARRGTCVELVSYVTRDLTLEALDDLTRDVRGVVHAAAFTPPEEHSVDALDKTLAANLGFLRPVFSAIANSSNCKRLLLVSSSAVYDQTKPGEVSEGDAGGGRSFYGSTKYAAELVARKWCALRGVEFCAMRPTSLVGPGEGIRESRLRVSPFLRLVAAAAAGREVRVERPLSRADWLGVDDAADAVSRVWHSPNWTQTAYNVSTGCSREWAGVVAAVARASGLRVVPDAELAVDGGPDLPAAVTSELLRLETGWKPQRSLEQIVGDLIEEGVPRLP
jgi:nucleoside-diphosphate-sugar epimerase